MRKYAAASLIALLLTGIEPRTVIADPQNPVWELGAGIGGQLLPDYRGSTRYRGNGLPFPYVRYQGKFLRADRDGVRGVFLATSDFEFNISADLSLATSGDDNDLRVGMPDLLPTFELGPSLNINLSGTDLHEGWSLLLPLRAVLATDLGRSEDAGWLFNPALSFRRQKVIGAWDLRSDFGLVYGSERYHRYFYSVEEQFVTDTRPLYQARAGYSGTLFKAGLRRRVGNLFLAGTLRYDNLSHAEFVDSPLVETRNYLSLSLGVAWIFWQSSTESGPE